VILEVYRGQSHGSLEGKTGSIQKSLAI